MLLSDDGLLVGSVPIGTTGLSKIIYDGTESIVELGFITRLNETTGKLLIDCRVTFLKYNLAGTKREVHRAHFLKATKVATLYMGL